MDACGVEERTCSIAEAGMAWYICLVVYFNHSFIHSLLTHLFSKSPTRLVTQAQSGP